MTIKGISPDDNSATLVSALLGALGATGTPPIERGSLSPISDFEQINGSTRRTGSNSNTRKRRKRKTGSNKGSLPAASVQGLNFADLKSSRKLTEGLLTTADGSSFCVASHNMIAETTDSAGSGKTSFASVEKLHDPACDDDAIDTSKHCQKAAAQQAAPRLSFMQAGVPAGAPVVSSLEDIIPTANASNLACTQGFNKVSLQQQQQLCCGGEVIRRNVDKCGRCKGSSCLLRG